MFYNNEHHQSGGTDVYALLCLGFLFFVMSGASVYFLIFGKTPIHENEIMNNIILSIGNLKTYTANVRIQPSQEFFNREAFKGTVDFDLENGISAGSFTIPKTAELKRYGVKVDTIGTNDKKFAKFSFEGGDGPNGAVFPLDWTEIDTAYEEDIYKYIEDSLATENALRIITDGKSRMELARKIIITNVDGTQVFNIFLRPTATQEDSEKKITPHLLRPEEGHDIHLLADATTFEIKEINYTVPGFSVTVSVVKSNEPLLINMPQKIIPYSEWREKALTSLSGASSFSEIIISSFGKVREEYLNGIVKAIQKATGAKTTIKKSSYILEPKNIYDTKSNSLRAEALLKDIKTKSAAFGKDKIVLYVMNEKMREFDTGKGDIWSYGEIGSNSAIVSLHGIKTSGATETADIDLAVSRAQKIALHSLGINLGFTYSSSSENPKCIMYPAVSLVEIDAKGVEYCKPESGLIGKIFKK